MSTTGWRHAYQASLVKVILAKGQPVLPDDSFYGWVDYDLLAHLTGSKAWSSNSLPLGPCEVIVTDDSVHENRIDEFAGTDATADRYEVAELRNCECTCGARKGFTMRYRGSLGDMLTALEALDEIAPNAVVPRDEVDAMISIALQHEKTSMASFQMVIQNLADTYANKAADSATPQDVATALALVAGDLLWALKQSGTRA